MVTIFIGKQAGLLVHFAYSNGSLNGTQRIIEQNLAYPSGSLNGTVLYTKTE